MTLALKHWKPILAGMAVLGLLIALLIAKADARHFRKLYTNAEAGRQLEIAKHAVTRTSVETCVRSIDDVNAAVARLKADGDARASAAAKALSEAQRASAGAIERARALEASAKVYGNPRTAACPGSAAYEAAREGL